MDDDMRQCASCGEEVSEIDAFFEEYKHEVELPAQHSAQEYPDEETWTQEYALCYQCHSAPSVTLHYL
jgi:hypothetical protein